MLFEHVSSPESGPSRKTPFRRPAAAVERVLRFVLLFLIRAYQVIVRPWLIGTCKFCPTCSEYGAEAIQVHGAVRGSLLAIKRVLRCRPFSMGGIDPVPAVLQGPCEPSAEPGGTDEAFVDDPARIR